MILGLCLYGTPPCITLSTGFPSTVAFSDRTHSMYGITPSNETGETGGTGETIFIMFLITNGL